MASEYQDQTRLEEFCLFVECYRSDSVSASSLKSSLESHFKNVWSEFATLTNGEGTSSSSSVVMRTYCELVRDGTSELIEKIGSSLLKKEEEEETPTNSISDLLLISFFSLAEIFAPLHQEHVEWRKNAIHRCTSSSNKKSYYSDINTTHHQSHTLQKQVAVASNAIVQENFRLPGTIFDPRRSADEVTDLLILDESDENKKSQQQQQKMIDRSSSAHIKSIQPFTMVGDASLKEQVQKIRKNILDEKKAREDKDCSSSSSSSSPLSSFVPELAITFQHLLGDVTNLLYRVCAQTPKNSPNCAFLTFLICDVSFYLAPVFYHPHHHPQDNQQEFLFSKAFFPNHFITTTASSNNNHDNGDNDEEDGGGRWLRGGTGDLGTSSCTKFEVALGCAIDCLIGDMEASVAECCNKFESESFAASLLTKLRNKTNNSNSTHHQGEMTPKNVARQPQQQDSTGATSTATQAEEKKIDYCELCSSGMLQFLTSTCHPILTVFRYFSSSSSSSEKEESINESEDDDQDAEAFIDVRAQILKSLLRFACSYWTRRKAKMSVSFSVGFADSVESKTLMVMNHDLKTLFDFCRKSLTDEKKDGELLEVVNVFEKRFLY